MPPVRLTDAELDAVFAAAAPLRSPAEMRFCRTWRPAVRRCGEVGPGAAYRCYLAEVHAPLRSADGDRAGRAVAQPPPRGRADRAREKRRALTLDPARHLGTGSIIAENSGRGELSCSCGHNVDSRVVV